MWMILKGPLVFLATVGALACGRGSSPRTGGIPMSASQPQPVSMAQAPTGSDGLYPVSVQGDAETLGAAAADARGTTNPEAHWGRIHGGDHPVPDDQWVAPRERLFRPRGHVRVAVSRARGDCTNGAVQKRLVARTASIRACYELAMYRNPKLAGRLVLSLRQTNTEAPETSRFVYKDIVTCSVLRDSLQDAPMAACVCRTIQRARLPWRTFSRAPHVCSVEAAFVFSSNSR